MNFTQFTKKIKQHLCGEQIKEEAVHCGVNIILSVNDKIFVDFKPTELSNIEEAKQYIQQIKFEEELAKELYEDIPAVKIANLIKEYHDVKITDTLIESYVNLASSKTFSVDPVIHGIRSFNSIDSLLENKIDYVLSDGTSVAIDEETQEMLNKLLEDKYQIVEYMRESKDNFMHVIKELS